MTHRINPLFSRYVAEPTLDLLGVATDAVMTPHAVGGRRSVSSKYYIGEDFPFGYNGWCCRVFDTLCCREFADSTDKLAEEVIHFCIFGDRPFVDVETALWELGSGCSTLRCRVMVLHRILCA